MANKKSETFNEIYTSNGSWINSFKNKAIIENAKTVIVIQDCYQALKLALTKKVIYITFDKDKCEFFNTRILINPLFGGDDKGFFVPFNVENREAIIENILKEEGFNENMKADLIIGNPPYEGNGLLYLKILKAVKKFSKEIIWLCPTKWCDIITTQYNLENECRNYNYESIIDVGNPFEGIAIDNVAIFHITENGKISGDDLWLRKVKNKELTKKIIEKLDKFESIFSKSLCSGHPRDKKELSKSHPFWVGVPGYYNNSRTDFDNTKYTLFKRVDNICSKKHNKDFYLHWWFKTENEAKNFTITCNSIIFKFGISFCKKNDGWNKLYQKFVPYLNDYTHPWSDKEICNELGITKEEYNYICDEMKPYM